MASKRYKNITFLRIILAEHIECEQAIDANDASDANAHNTGNSLVRLVWPTYFTTV